MAMLEPKMCILDETDSGLDVDAMKLVAEGVNALRDAGRGFLVITHYQRLLDHIKPDVVHIMAGRTGTAFEGLSGSAPDTGWLLKDCLSTSCSITTLLRSTTSTASGGAGARRSTSWSFVH